MMLTSSRARDVDPELDDSCESLDLRPSEPPTWALFALGTATLGGS